MLFDQTVTVYRVADGQVLRRVLHGCSFQKRQEMTEEKGILRHFFLMVPGQTVGLLPGDRILEGQGPEIGLEQWPEFIPAIVPELVQVKYAKGFSGLGELSHWEGGA